MSSSWGGAWRRCAGPAGAAGRRPGRGPGAVPVPAAAARLALAARLPRGAGGRRTPPTTQRTTHTTRRPKPAQIVGERTVLEAQRPTATTASQTRPSRPAQVEGRAGAAPGRSPGPCGPCGPGVRRATAISRPSRVSPAARGRRTADSAGILPICHSGPPRPIGDDHPLHPGSAAPGGRGPGVPYGGSVDHERQLAPSPFPGDAGLADPATRRALAAAVGSADPAAYLRAVAALCTDRLLVPVVATATRLGDDRRRAGLGQGGGDVGGDAAGRRRPPRPARLHRPGRAAGLARRRPARSR